MLRKLTAGAAVLGALAAASPATAAAAAPSPTPDEMMVIDVGSVNGSGCDNDSATVTVSPDNKAFTVSYSEYLAQVGPEAKPTDFRKNCLLQLQIKVPNGFTFAIATADYRGFADLQKGAYADQIAGYYFQGYSQTNHTQHRIKGPFNDNWQRTDQVGIASLNFLNCGDRRNLNINTELRVNRGTSDRKLTSFITMDATDGNLDTIYRIAWKKCGG
ncbi:DUF4360 domain-containing protein [Actinoplanes sp. DH11]|uniref:DUF4360 domain-containing protein n=1 Tax=Actinoplanes sp. DH11 TaxID=2857011 RepID=UPI001E3473EF|nr:DUF4360 domain-containing protein [Actinoplanes sp. DH11]